MTIVKEIAIRVAVILLFAALGQGVAWVVDRLADRPFTPPGYIIGIIMGVGAGEAIALILRQVRT